MGKIDKEKEQIGWIKFWIGVGVASIMGLISYFVNHYDKADKIILEVPFSYNDYRCSFSCNFCCYFK